LRESEDRIDAIVESDIDSIIVIDTAVASGLQQVSRKDARLISGLGGRRPDVSMADAADEVLGTPAI